MINTKLYSGVDLKDDPFDHFINYLWSCQKNTQQTKISKNALYSALVSDLQLFPC